MVVVVVVAVAVAAATVSVYRLESGRGRVGVSKTSARVENGDGLLARVTRARDELRAKYSDDWGAKLDDYVGIVASPQLAQACAARLEEPTTERPFLIGVTGGSATQGVGWSWPFRALAALKSVFSKENDPAFELRNAAQGSANHLLASMCLEALVGRDTDLVMWEFTLNEPGFIPNAVPPARNNAAHSAQIFLASAAQLRPHPPACGAGFLFLWDLGVHLIGNEDLFTKADDGAPSAIIPLITPSPALTGTPLELARHASFWVRLVPLLTMMGVRKVDALRDSHHPNNATYGVIGDLVAFAVLGVVERGLLPPRTDPPAPDSSSDVTATPKKPPRVTTPEDFIRQFHGRAVCHMVRVPFFLPDDQNQVRLAHGSPAAKPRIVDVGKSLPGRTDRLLRVLIPPCPSTEASWTIDIAEFDKPGGSGSHALRALGVHCVEGVKSPCDGDRLRVTWNGLPLVRATESLSAAARWWTDSLPWPLSSSSASAKQKNKHVATVAVCFAELEGLEDVAKPAYMVEHLFVVVDRA